MLAHFIYSTLLAFGLIKFIPFGLSTPAVVQSNAPSSAGQVAAPASEGFGSSSSPELALAGLRQARDDPSGAYGEFGGGGEFSVVTGCTVSGTAALTFVRTRSCFDRFPLNSDSFLLRLVLQDDGPWIYTYALFWVVSVFPFFLLLSFVGLRADRPMYSVFIAGMTSLRC